MNKLKSLILLLSAMATSTHAQKKYAEYSVETLHFQNIDRTLESVRNTGPGLRLGYSLIREKTEYVNSFRFNGMVSFLKAPIEKSRNSIIGNLNVSFDRQKKITENFLLGISIQASYKNSFYKNIDQSHLYWVSMIGGGLTTTYILYANNSGALSTNLNLPLLGIVSRNKEDRLYKVDDPSISNILKLNHSNYEFASVKDYFNPIIEIMYTHSLSKRNIITLFFRSEYTNISISNNAPYKEIQNGVGLRLKSLKREK